MGASKNDGPYFAPFEGWGYENDGDTLYPNFDNGTAIEVKVV